MVFYVLKGRAASSQRANMANIKAMFDGSATAVSGGSTGGNGVTPPGDAIAIKARNSNKHSNKCLTVANASTWNGANITQWKCHGGWSQQFRLTGSG